MTAPPVVGFPDTPLSTLADTMISRGINRVPITEHGRLVGIVTRGDVLRAIMGGHEGPTTDRPRVVLESTLPLPRKGWVTEWARF
jgi:CBS domain-containing protein